MRKISQTRSRGQELQREEPAVALRPQRIGGATITGRPTSHLDLSALFYQPTESTVNGAGSVIRDQPDRTTNRSRETVALSDGTEIVFNTIG